MVKGSEYRDEDMRTLDATLYEYFEDKLMIKKEFVEDIPREASGKTRFCISKIPLPWETH